LFWIVWLYYTPIGLRITLQLLKHTLTIGTAGIDAVRPRSLMVIDFRLLNAEDRCKLLLGELPDALVRRDRLASCLATTGGRTDVAVEKEHRDGNGRWI